MAIGLNITDGSTTYDLTSGVYEGVTYAPVPVSFSEAMQPDATTTETIEIRLSGTSNALRDSVQYLERMISLARRRQDTGTGARIYIQYTPYSAADTYRSEIVDGSIELDSNPGLRRMDWTTIRIAMHIERRAFWEGDEAELANALIDNGEAGNYVDIDNGDVAGTLPAPCKVTLENQSGGALDFNDVYLSCNTFNDPANFTGILGGAALSWTGAVTHASDQVSWTLTDAMLADLAGDYFRILAVFTTVTSTHYWRANVKFSNATLQAGNELSCPQNICDLGTFALPPGGWNTASSGVKLTISARASATGSATLDFVQLMPADNFRYLSQFAYDIANGGAVVDDGIEGTAYVLESVARKPLIIPRGKPLMVYPNKDARVYALMQDATTYDPTWDMRLKVAYRPRKTLV